VSRYLLSLDADQDLAELDVYLDRLSMTSARAISVEIIHALRSIGSHPFMGVAHSDLTRAYGEEIRSRLAAGYRIYYRVSRTHPEILAILHGSRDQRTEMLRRVQ
jgi:plasmid stabilization system protein ParE